MCLKLEVSQSWLVIIKGLSKKFSCIIAPLTQLTKTSVKFEWNEKCEEAF